MDPIAMEETHRVTPSETGRVLIADDQMHVLDALQMLLSGCGLATEAVTQPARVLQSLETGQFDAVLMDLNFSRDTTSGGEGLELLSQIRSMDNLFPVVLMTAWSNVDLAVEAMRRGASDFIQKPWENQDLLQKLRNHLSWARARRRARRLRDEELHEAREIQDSLLPRKLPAVAGYEIAAMTKLELEMRTGDKLLLFTDGLVDACNADEESFGEHNVIRIAWENPSSSAEELMGLLMCGASQHSGEHFQDDASLIVLKAIKQATLDLDQEVL